MARSTRRSFIKHTLATAATVTIAGTKSSGKVIGANDTIRIAVAGLNGRGGSHVGEFGKMKNVEIAYIVDPDTSDLQEATGSTRQSRTGPKRRRRPTFARFSKTRNSTPFRSRRRTTGIRLMTIWALRGGQGCVRREAVLAQHP